VQRIDGALEIDSADRAKYRHRRRHRHRIGLIERIGLMSHPRLAVAEDIQAVIHRQPIEPGAERRFAPEAAELPIGKQENVLEEIVGIPVRTHHPARQIVEPGGVLPGRSLNAAPPDRMFYRSGRRFSYLGATGHLGGR
jgi:hypothetical protein